jgi:hypothetical protein
MKSREEKQSFIEWFTEVCETNNFGLYYKYPDRNIKRCEYCLLPLVPKRHQLYCVDCALLAEKSATLARVHAFRDRHRRLERIKKLKEVRRLKREKT